MTLKLTLVAGLVVVGTVLGAGTAMATAGPQTELEAAHADPADPDPAFAIALQPNGNAEVHVTYTFDLSDDARAAAFEEIKTNETVKQAFENRFTTRLQTVAAEAENATGRDMAVRDIELNLQTVDGTGIVELSLVWEGLAAVDGARLVVTEPFASGFEPDRPVHLSVPNGYEVTSVNPEPDTTSAEQIIWETGSDLTGFEATMTQSETTAETTQGEDGPGFGLLAPLIAVIAAIGLLARLE